MEPKEEMAKSIGNGATNSCLDENDTSLMFVYPESIPERLYCVKCRKRMNDPCVIRTCGHNICYTCVSELTHDGTTSGLCPGDGREKCDIGTFSKSDVIVDKGLKRDMQDLRVYCPHRKQGCSAEMSLADLNRHLEDCFVEKLSGTQNNVLLDVIAQQQHQIDVMHDDLDHVKTECEEQLHKIHDLEETVQKSNVRNKLTEKRMAELLLKRNNNTLNQSLEDVTKDLNQLKIQAENQDTKISTMETAMTETFTAGPIGQTRNMLRKINEKVALHDIELSEQDIRIQCVENATDDGKLVLKISNFSDHMDKAKSGKTLSIYSQPFYTDARGYKMCGRVYLNGDGIGKGTHISFYFVLMKGTYDDLLQWPFNYNITLGAIDPNSGGIKTIKETFRPSSNSSSFKKPVSTMNIASGCPKFLSHADLYSGPFIKDDTLYLTIEVSKPEN